MRSALVRKSVTDLTRRRARTLFAAATLALAVASIGIFALPTLMDRAMAHEVAAGKLPDLSVWMNPVVLDETDLATLERLPNVAAVEARSWVAVRVYVGARRTDGYVLGVHDFARQDVGVVHLASGSLPRAGEVLTEAQNERQGIIALGAGDAVRVVAGDGSVRTLRVSGEGRNLDAGQDVAEDNLVVLYATAPTVAELRGAPGDTGVAIRLRDTSPEAAAFTLGLVRRTLETVPGFTGFTDLPELRTAEDWPGKEDFERFSDFFYVITVLAILSALVLVSNTMTTLVAEQTGEIGVMKAVGGRRRQIAFVYVRTALLLGALGTVVGVALGVLLSNMLVRFIGSTFFAIDVGFGVDPLVLIASVALGVLGPPLAALPAIRRGVRVDLREALEASGSAVGPQDTTDVALRRIRFLPRTAQIGLRGVGRRRRRSFATALIVALAVGNLLAILGLAASISNATHAAWRDHGEDVKVTSEGRRPLDASAAAIMRATPGVAAVEPMFTADVGLAGEDAIVWAVPQRTMFGYDMAEGRWYTAAEERDRARVVVVQRGIARLTGVRVGDRVEVETASGPTTFTVIGIADNQQESGIAVFVPRETMRTLLAGTPAAKDDWWVQTTSGDHGLVDRVTTLLEDRLTAAGYEVATEVEYVDEADNVATNRTITTTIAVLGFVIVAISMVGLANAITMSVLERTREIGILRTIGARARDVRRIFAAEGVALAVAGWLMGVPIGYALYRFLVWLLREVVNVEVPLTFPLGNVVLALVGTVVLALLVVALPIRRATRAKPGEALRYA
ncbi:MAG: FtsX-like permease family protein [Pseudomonadota bacterium]